MWARHELAGSIPRGGTTKTKMLSEQLQNLKTMRLALVSASGTPTATNLSFWRLRALGTSKIGFLGKQVFMLTERMFPDVNNTIC